MALSQVISRYALALLELSKDRGELDNVDASFAEVVKSVQTHPEISNLLLNSTIAREEKEDFLEKVFPNPLSRLVINFLKVLVKKNRFQEVTDIQKEFHRLVQAEKGIVEVRATVAISLSSEVEEKLRQGIKKAFNTEIDLTVKVDPQMLGGLVIQYGGLEVNGSYKYRLQKLKQNLLA